VDRSIDGFPRFFLGEVGCWVFGQMAAHESLTRQRVPPICTHPHTRQRASRPSMDDRGRSRKKINARRETRDAGRLIPYTRYKNTHVMRKNTHAQRTHPHPDRIDVDVVDPRSLPTNGGVRVVSAAASCDARARMKATIMDDDRMVKSAWTPEVRANAKDLSFFRKPARTRAPATREPARGVERGTPHTAGVTTRGGPGRARG